MVKFLKKKTKEELSSFMVKHFSADKTSDADQSIEILIQLVEIIRPEKSDIKVSLEPLIQILNEDDNIRNNFRTFIHELFGPRNFIRLLSDTKIVSTKSFSNELRKSLVDNILPDGADENTVKFVLNQVFYQINDHVWVQRLKNKEISALIELVGMPNISNSVHENSILNQLFYALEMLTLRLGGVALEKDIANMVPEYFNLKNPFLALTNEIDELHTWIEENNQLISIENEEYKQVVILLNQCKRYVEQAYKNSSTYGISLTVNKELTRLSQQISRIETILTLVTTTGLDDEDTRKADLIKRLITINSSRSRLRNLISESTQLLSLEVTSHTAKTGEKYITNSKKEYYEMLKAALGGGIIVGILCVIKVLFSKIDTSEFGDAFLYSMNYSLGFITIYVLGFTLATKQPAMTASTLMSHLAQDKKNNNLKNERYQEFAQFFARLIRSQFIAFVGNVFMAFPVSLLGVWAIDYFTDHNIVQQKWPVLLTDLSPIHSPAVFHASIAGVFLFMSGLIAGQVANRNKFYKIPKRLRVNSLLKSIIGTKRLNKLVDFYEAKWPGIISNLWFGIFMGSTASIGSFLGLNLDIRHITFASGNFALGLYGTDFKLTTDWWIWCILGIGLIGFFNFIVSFSLSMFLAFKSQNLTRKEIPPLVQSIWTEFKKNPFTFLFPIKRTRE